MSIDFNLIEAADDLRREAADIDVLLAVARLLEWHRNHLTVDDEVFVRFERNMGERFTAHFYARLDYQLDGHPYPDSVEVLNRFEVALAPLLGLN